MRSQLLSVLLLSTLVLLRADVATGHVPHDNIYDIAVPLDLDPTKHWMFAGYQAISETRSGGNDWVMTGGLPLIDEITSAALLDNGTTLFLAERRLWWTQDEGASYDYLRFDIPTRDLESIGNQIALLTDNKLEVGTLDAFLGKEDMTFSYSINANTMKASDQGISIVSESGNLWLIPSDTVGLTPLTPSPTSATVLSSITGGTKAEPLTFVGDSEGKVWRLTGAMWSKCGELPESDHPAVVELEVDGTRLFAAPASSAPFMSTDDCATWEDYRAPTETEFNNSGGAESDQSAFTVLRVRGDLWMVGGWDGLWLSRDNGDTWEDVAVIPSDFTRGIAFSKRFPEDPTVYIGAYGGGIQVSRDGGASFTSPNWGISQTNVQRIETTKRDVNRVSAIAAHFAHVSDDGGRNWRELNDSFPMDREVFSYTNPDEIWVFGKQLATDGFNGRVAYSRDNGNTFLEPEALNAVMPMGAEYVLRYENKKATLSYMATGGDGIFLADAIEGPWTQVLGEFNITTGGGGPSLWPSVAPERAIIAKGGSVFVSFDGGLTWDHSQLLDDLDEITKSLFASDGTAFAITTAGRVFRSDTGKDWSEIIVAKDYIHPHYTALPAQVYEVKARPDFENYREILIGTHDGVYVLTDSKVPTVSRWSGWQIIDNKADFVHCHGCPTDQTEPNDEPYPQANFGGISRINQGIEMAVQLRGHTIILSGVITDPSIVHVYIDGEFVDNIGQKATTDLSKMRPLTTIDGLEDGWHYVEVVGIKGDGVLIDTFSSVTEAQTLQGLPATGETGETGETGPTGSTDTHTPIDDPSDCGCSTSAPHAMWLALLAPVWLLRRSKAHVISFLKQDT